MQLETQSEELNVSLNLDDTDQQILAAIYYYRVRRTIALDLPQDDGTCELISDFLVEDMMMENIGQVIFLMLRALFYYTGAKAHLLINNNKKEDALEYMYQNMIIQVIINEVYQWLQEMKT